uniref:Lectin n=1 Tax=Euperipatoides rowelli TaxID=49087 RepID=D9IX76_EUPRO|nr:lectin [Euperipatoides rowelli]
MHQIGFITFFFLIASVLLQIKSQECPVDVRVNCKDIKCQIGRAPTPQCTDSIICAGKKYTVPVKFASAFASPPEVMVALSVIDSSKSTNLRIETRAEAITQNGFNIIVNTWGDTILLGAWVSWIACPR